jgi:hypothetical protein
MMPALNPRPIAAAAAIEQPDVKKDLMTLSSKKSL